MQLPVLSSTGGSAKSQLVQFGGINFSDAASEGELAAGSGLSTKKWPFLSQRGPRAVEGTYTAASAIYAWGKLCVVDGNNLIYDGETVGTVDEGEKQFAVVNTKLCIFPDKKYLDLDSLEFGDLGAEVQASAGSVTFAEDGTLTMALCPVEQSTQMKYGLAALNSTTQANWQPYFKVFSEDDISWSADGGWGEASFTEKRLDQLSAGDCLMCAYSDVTGSHNLDLRWGSRSYAEQFDKDGYYAVVTSVDGEYAVYYSTSVTVHYDLKCAGSKNADMTTFFSAGDTVEITGCTSLSENNITATCKTVTAHGMCFDSGVLAAGTETSGITITRKVPDLDYICQCDNRLFGVSNADKTIYASALGSPKNFFTYDGLDTDSYAVAVGTDGDFTGCCAYSGSVLFWKENCLHKLLGNYPSDFYLYTYNISGVQDGSHKSLRIINEVLFYKGRNGVYSYTGGTPQLISYCFGNRLFSHASAGTDGARYYLSMQDADEAWHLFVYDTVRGIWQREDDTHAADFATLGDTMYLLSGNTVYSTEQADADEDIEWMAEFVPFTETVQERKCYSRLFLRADPENGAWVQAEIRCDDGPWRTVYAASRARQGTMVIPIVPTRCDSFAVRLSGKGRCTIKSMTRVLQKGSEV